MFVRTHHKVRSNEPLSIMRMYKTILYPKRSVRTHPYGSFERTWWFVRTNHLLSHFCVNSKITFIVVRSNGPYGSFERTTPWNLTMHNLITHLIKPMNTHVHISLYVHFYRWSKIVFPSGSCWSLPQRSKVSWWGLEFQFLQGKLVYRFHLWVHICLREKRRAHS